MGIEAYSANQLEQSKKYLKLYRYKQKKAAKKIWILATIALLSNLFCLLLIKFVSYKDISVSFFDLFSDFDKLDVGGLKFFYILYWAVVAVGIIVTAVNYKNRNNEGAWITPQMVISILLTIVSGFMLFMHMLEELDYTYGETSSFIWWCIPLFINIIYCVTPILAFVYKKYIPIFENNVKKLESKD